MEELEREKAESKIQQEIVMYYHNSYCLVHHNPRQMIIQIPNQNHQNISLFGGIYIGASDTIIIHNLQPKCVEVKIPGGTLRPSQKKFRDHCKQSGIPYYIVDNLEDFKQLIKQWDHPKLDHLV